MKEQIRNNSEKPMPSKYCNAIANYWTCTDEGIAYFYKARKEFAREIQTLTQQQKTETEREMKKYYGQLIKDQKAWEKAANIWINHFTTCGGKNMANFPLELSEKLNTIFWGAENAT